MPVGEAGMPELVGAAIQEGLTVRACCFCLAERGLRAEKTMEGMEIASMLDLVDWVVQSGKIIIF